MIAIMTYNLPKDMPSGHFKWGGTEYLILLRTFADEDGRKAPHLVRHDHPNWQELLSRRHELTKIVIFAGKKDSGALEIIRLVMEAFKDELDKIYFVLCDHELEEKKVLINTLGGTGKNYIFFGDHHAQCQEDVLLMGLMMKYAQDPWKTAA